MEQGNTYCQEFEDGDRIYFLAVTRCKSGGWRGYLCRHWAGRPRASMPRKYIADPTVPAWRTAAQKDIPAPLAALAALKVQP